MSKENNTQLKDLFVRRSFTDDDGEVVASYRINPADVGLARRCDEISEFFENLGKNAPSKPTYADLCRLNDEIEDKICYLLGYDAKKQLFGFISAVSIMPDGHLFAVMVIEDILQAISPQVKQRAASMKRAIEKHTKRYK